MVEETSCKQEVPSARLFYRFSNTNGAFVGFVAITNPSVTFVHRTQGIEDFGNMSSSLCTLAIL